jgi:hypothetical protein
LLVDTKAAAIPMVTSAISRLARTLLAKSVR